jgi:hypothetical protein
MAEIVGLVSGVFTLARVVTDGLGLVMELYKAPEEIKMLKVGGNISMTFVSMFS